MHARGPHSHRFARAIGMTLTGGLAFATAAGATTALTLAGNIDSTDADAVLEGVDRPEAEPPSDPNAGTALNIVLLGSDDRSGENGELVADGEVGARSDTTIILHVSADRSRVELVSVPRDSTVSIPSCPTTNGEQTEAIRSSKFNAAFAQGVLVGGDVHSGAICTLHTLETLTGVRMDGYVVVDFAGFQQMIDAVGGVDMCIAEDVYAPKANELRLDAGMKHLDGWTALNYARARTGEGLDGSDTSRIGRQQELLAALSRAVLAQDVLTDAPRLLDFLDALTSSLTTSDNFASVSELTGLAFSLRSLRAENISFMTVPFTTDPENRANVTWTDEAGTLWANLKADLPALGQDTSVQVVSPSTPATTATPSSTATGPAPTPTPTVTRKAGEEAFSSADVTSVCG